MQRQTIEMGSEKQVFSLNLKEIARDFARDLLRRALEEEVAQYVSQKSAELTSDGLKRHVRNGYGKTRVLTTELGAVEVQQPRVRDREGTIKFRSSILPPYIRRTPTVENMIPYLWLKGISTGKMREVMEVFFDNGVSPALVSSLCEQFVDEYKQWNMRRLDSKQYAYWWVDGIYSNVRLTDERSCLLTIIGCTHEGQKELVAVCGGTRESKESWLSLLRDLYARGLTEAPKLCIGDGAMGFWSAIEEFFPQSKAQLCWVHKTRNILDKVPKQVQEEVKGAVHRIYMSETSAEAQKQIGLFRQLYAQKNTRAWECLNKDVDHLLAFYDFPKEHWQSIRSTNAIESTFATERHRHRQTKGNGTLAMAEAMIWRLATEAEKSWRKLNAPELVGMVITGKQFKDGILYRAENLNS